MAVTTQPLASMPPSQVMSPSGSSLRDGAQSAAIPRVGWAQATTSRPPAGAAPPGTNTIPDDTVGVPSAYSLR